MYNEQTLKNMSNKMLLNCYEASYYTVIKNACTDNRKAHAQLQKELLRRLEEKEK